MTRSHLLEDNRKECGVDTITISTDHQALLLNKNLIIYTITNAAPVSLYFTNDNYSSISDHYLYDRKHFNSNKDINYIC